MPATRPKSPPHSAPATSVFEVEALALLRAIVARQAALAEEVAAIRACVDFDRGALAALLPALDATIGSGYVWTARELCEHAQTEGSLLRAPVAAIVGAFDARAAPTLGKYLHRVEGLSVGGLRIERVGVGREGALRILRRE